MVVFPTSEKIFPPLLGLHLAQSSMAKPRLLCWEGDASLRLDLSVSSLRRGISWPSIFLRPLAARGSKRSWRTADYFPVPRSPEVAGSIWRKTNPLCVSRGSEAFQRGRATGYSHASPCDSACRSDLILCAFLVIYVQKWVSLLCSFS